MAKNLKFLLNQEKFNINKSTSKKISYRIYTELINARLFF